MCNRLYERTKQRVYEEFRFFNEADVKVGGFDYMRRRIEQGERFVRLTKEKMAKRTGTTYCEIAKIWMVEADEALRFSERTSQGVLDDPNPELCTIFQPVSKVEYFQGTIGEIPTYFSLTDEANARIEYHEAFVYWKDPISKTIYYYKERELGEKEVEAIKNSGHAERICKMSMGDLKIIDELSNFAGSGYVFTLNEEKRRVEEPMEC